jgi:hypothetical protein
MNYNNNIIDQFLLDQYIGDQVDPAVGQLKAMYPNFEVQKLHQDLIDTDDYIYNRIRVRYDDQFKVISVYQG